MAEQVNAPAQVAAPAEAPQAVVANPEAAVPQVQAQAAPPPAGQAQAAAPQAGQAQAAAPQAGQAQAAAGAAQIRRVRRPFRFRRYRYSNWQKQRAIQLLDQGMTCRRAAVLTAPQCSAGTVCKWRKARNLRRQQEAQRNNRLW